MTFPLVLMGSLSKSTITELDKRTVETSVATLVQVDPGAVSIQNISDADTLSSPTYSERTTGKCVNHVKTFDECTRAGKLVIFESMSEVNAIDDGQLNGVSYDPPYCCEFVLLYCSF